MYNTCRSQAVPALSSGEGEYYALTSAAADCLLLRAVFEFLDFEGVKPHLKSDSSAARGICHRLGVGKVRHLETKTLWLQHQTRSGVLTVGPIKGLENTGGRLGMYDRHHFRAAIFQSLHYLGRFNRFTPWSVNPDQFCTTTSDNV